MVIEKAAQIKLNKESKGLLASLGKSPTTAGAAAGLGFAGATGIASLVAGLKVFEPIVNIVKKTLDLLSQFLQPIADVILLLLMPILQILKPILIVVRQIMQPFRQLAFSLSRQAGQALREGDKTEAAGLFGLSFAALGLGVEAVFAFFTKETIKGFISSLGELFKAIFPFLSDQIDVGIKAAQDSIDFAVASLITTQAFAISKAATELGADVTREFGNIVGLMNKMFIGEDNSFKATFDALTTVMTDKLQPELDEALGNFSSSLGNFVDDINAKARGIRSGAGSAVASGARRAIDNIFQQGLIRTLPIIL